MRRRTYLTHPWKRLQGTSYSTPSPFTHYMQIRSTTLALKKAILHKAHLLRKYQHLNLET